MIFCVRTPASPLLLVALTAAELAIGCTRQGATAASAKNAGIPACEYELTVTEADGTGLEVTARCRDVEIEAYTSTRPEALDFISEVRATGGAPLKRHDDGWSLSEPTTMNAIEYRVDLGGFAQRHDDFDLAQRSGDSVIAPLSSWALRPEPVPPKTSVFVRVRTPGRARFATGLERREDGYFLQAREIRVGTYGVFGQFRTQARRVPGPRSQGTSSQPANIEVVVMDGRFALEDRQLGDWVEKSARAIGGYWPGFPIHRATVVLMPGPGKDRVTFGKVLPAGGETVVLQVGAHAGVDDLYRDWILVHELFHLGFPSFSDEGKWLDEGLATYVEPIVRARAGWLDDHEVWHELAENLPKGIDAMQTEGLEQAKSFSAIYWGGALLCLMTDIETRRRSEGRLGLEDGLAALVEKGASASDVWDLRKTIQIIDEALGDPILEGLADRYAFSGSRVPFDALLEELGIERSKTGIALSNRGPGARLRSQILKGR